MTERRRFFPSRRVQQVPGARAELEVQLRPDAPPVQDCPPSACVCDVLGPALLVDWSVNALTYTDAGYQGMPTGYLGQLYDPKFEDWRVVDGIAAIDMFDSRYFRAVLAGKTTCDVQWRWALDVPPLPDMSEIGYEASWGGVEVTEQAGTLLIEVLPGSLGWEFASVSQPWHATLTMTATCAGQDVGTLVLRPGWLPIGGW